MGILRAFNDLAKQETERGGIRATFFVYAMEWLENMAFISNVISLGYAALTAQAHFHRLRPPSCQGLAISQTTQCQAADSIQAAILSTGLYLVAFGASGVKTALLSLGADQFDERDPKRSSFSTGSCLIGFAIGAIIGVPFIVWSHN